MPYIEHSRRKEMLDNDYCEGPKTAGELNYWLTLTIKDYWENTGNYQGINDIVGALEGAKMEFYRRIAVPYEDKKIAENGDVY